MIAWVIIWGTHVRNRQVGVRGEFCGQCLRVSRFAVKKIETVGHLYYIPLGAYSLHSVIGECHTCGALVGLNASHLDSVVSKQAAAGQSIVSVVGATNPGLLPALSNIAQEIDSQIPPAHRDHYLMNCFCARLLQKFKDADSSLGGWLALVLIVFLILGGFAFAAGGPVTGTATAAALLSALFGIRHWAIHRRVAKSVRPLLARFLNATGIEWAQLEAALESGELKYPKLKRHFQRPAYDAFRQEGGLEEFLENGNCDVIVPEVDVATAAREK